MFNFFRLKIFLIHFVILIAIIVISAVFLEISYACRTWLSAQFYGQVSTNGSQRFLIMSDSVMGFLDDPHSISSIMANRLKLEGNDFQFKEISAPALQSNAVIDKIEETISDYRPSVVVMMFGKGDFNRPNRLSRLRLYRLLDAAYWDLRSRWYILFPYRDLMKAWALNRLKGCGESVPIFEKAIVVTDDRRAIKALQACYYSSGLYARGVHYFENLQKTSSHAEYIQQFIAVLKYRMSQADEKLPKPLFLETHAELATQDQIKTRMWYYLVRKQPALFKDEYLRHPVGASFKLPSRAVENISEIVRQLSLNSAKVFIVSYPLDHVEVLQSSLESTGTKANYLDLRSFLSRLPEDKLIRIWGEDIEHLTHFGSEVVADWLALQIKNEIQ